jgi:hypothetical protein
MSTFVPIMIALVFILVIGTIIYRAVKGAGKWSYNNAQPVLTVDAAVVAKRSDVTSSMSDINGGSMHHHHTYTTYFITFEVESGDRMEFKIGEDEYGLLVEGDRGRLTFQGSRYLGFARAK